MEQEEDPDIQKWIQQEDPTGRSDLSCLDPSHLIRNYLQTDCSTEAILWQGDQACSHLPFAGHLGREKTAQRILRRFYWPMLFHDIKQYCQTCEKCQLHGGCKTRAPMFLLLTIGEPFKRIALDVVGPLPRTGWGNHFILVVSDYATRFPKAIPLRSVTAKKVAEVLIDLFARYGIPEEILTDQGSNFTSSLLGELYRLVGIKAMTGYYRRFIRDYATIAEPLTELTRKSLPEEIVWNERAELAYHERSHTLRLSESVWP